jgi:hypothetical protein
MVKHALLVLLVACQGTSSDKPKPIGSEPPIVVVEDAAPEVSIDAPPMAEPEPPDPGKVIADLGAIPAWQAVVDRAQLLARRGQRGIVYGRIGPAVMQLGPTPEPAGSGAKPLDAGMVPSPYVWLVDDTEGNGTLGIRVQLETAVKEGDRVALAGSWLLDDQKRWYWKVDTVTPLPAAPASDIPDPVAPFPTHEIASGGLPAGARTITVARDNDAVYFQIVGPAPARDGDGWFVANQLGDVPFARLQLPGERASYGGQDMRAPDERWQLKRAKTYWVRIGKIRKSPKPDEPANINARTAPVLLN